MDNRKNNRHNQNQKSKRFGEEGKVEKLNKPLSEKYKDKSDIYLEEGTAYKIAKEMGDIPPHQLRKILNLLKDAVGMVKKNSDSFEVARDKLYYIVPLTAYNAGRDSKLKPLYNFVYSHINEKTIMNIQDIEVLDQLFTSMIAYHKFLNKKSGGKR